MSLINKARSTAAGLVKQARSRYADSDAMQKAGQQAGQLASQVRDQAGQQAGKAGKQAGAMASQLSGKLKDLSGKAQSALQDAKNKRAHR